MMFDLTDGAATLVRALTLDADLGPGSGLRFTVDPTWGSLAMSVAASPGATDGVFTHRHARVFVSPSAADRLDARTLDARGERPAFFLVGR